MRRLVNDSLTKRLRIFAGTESAQAALSHALPPDFSRKHLVEALEEIRLFLPVSSLYNRMLMQPEFLSEMAPTQRTWEWELSRSVLLTALRELRLDPSLRFSLSHTEGAGLAIAVSGVDRGFGVDLEQVGRIISDAAFARFFLREEEIFLRDRLDHWVMKEACYKAHPRSNETIIADYVIIENLEVADENQYMIECRKGSIERFRAVLGTIEEYRYAFARQL